MRKYGRYTRYRNSSMGLSIFIFVIILAIAAGYAGTKYIVFPYLLENKTDNSQIEDTKNAENSHDENTDVITSTPGIIIDQQDIKDETSDSSTETTTAASENDNPIYANQTGKGPFSVQFGSFSSKSGAEALSSELTSKGIYSYVYESGGSHKVLGLPYANKEKAMEAAKIVSTAVTDVFVVDISTLIK